MTLRYAGMRKKVRLSLWSALMLGPLAGTGVLAQSEGPDPLPSWNDGTAKQEILDFVRRITLVGGPDFIADE